jgi:hypothetical protein
MMVTIRVHAITRCQFRLSSMTALGSPRTGVPACLGCLPSSYYHLVIDSRDPHAQARFWSATLDQPILFEAADEVIVTAPSSLHGPYGAGLTQTSEYRHSRRWPLNSSLTMIK